MSWTPGRGPWTSGTAASGICRSSRRPSIRWLATSCFRPGSGCRSLEPAGSFHTAGNDSATGELDSRDGGGHTAARAPRSSRLPTMGPKLGCQTQVWDPSSRLTERLPKARGSSILNGRQTLVAGAGGFIGGHLVGDLVRRGCAVRAVDLKPLEEWQQLHPGAENVRLDL